MKQLSWTTFAALSLAVVVLFCIWKFLPSHPEALMLAGVLAAGVMSQFQKLLAKTGTTIPPPPDKTDKKS